MDHFMLLTFDILNMIVWSKMLLPCPWILSKWSSTALSTLPFYCPSYVASKLVILLVHIYLFRILRGLKTPCDIYVEMTEISLSLNINTVYVSVDFLA